MDSNSSFNWLVLLFSLGIQGSVFLYIRVSKNLREGLRLLQVIMWVCSSISVSMNSMLDLFFRICMYKNTWRFRNHNILTVRPCVRWEFFCLLKMSCKSNGQYVWKALEFNICLHSLLQFYTIWWAPSE